MPLWKRIRRERRDTQREKRRHNRKRLDTESMFDEKEIKKLMGSVM